MNKKQHKQYIADLNGLLFLLRYETADGVHTYHDCECGRLPTRRGKCTICMTTEFSEKYKEK